MPPEFINLTAENLADEHLCCIIRSKKPHPGVEAKRQWLSERLKDVWTLTTITTRINVSDKAVFCTFCSDIELNASTAINTILSVL